jgi:hypothetical protein
MVNGLSSMDLALPQRHPQRVQGQVGAHVIGDAPSDDEPRETVNHERAIRFSAPGRHLGKEVLLRIYAKCIDGDEEIMNARIEKRTWLDQLLWCRAVSPR